MTSTILVLMYPSFLAHSRTKQSDHQREVYFRFKNHITQTDGGAPVGFCGGGAGGHHDGGHATLTATVRGTAEHTHIPTQLTGPAQKCLDELETRIKYLSTFCCSSHVI